MSNLNGELVSETFARLAGSGDIDGAVRMKIDRFVGIDELSDYMPELESGSIASTTTVEVDESTRVTFQV